MTKLIIPITLAAVLAVTGIFAIMPVDQATTVHTTILTANAGVACASEVETFAFTNAAQNDIVTITITPAMFLTSLEIAYADAGVTEDLGFDAITIETTGAAASAIDNLDAFDTGEDTVNGDTDNILGEVGIYDTLDGVGLDAGAQISITIADDVDDSNAQPDTADTLTFTVCGITTDPANFAADDIAVATVAG